MSEKLISLSPDLLRLREEGYAISIKGAYLLVGDVPYLNRAKEVKFGTLASTLCLAGDRTGRPEPHTALFVGQEPCDFNGTPMEFMIADRSTTNLVDGLTANFTFSRKPKSGYHVDYYEKMLTYVEMLQAEARKVNPDVDARTRRAEPPDEGDNSPFNYLDTASSRAGINLASEKLKLGKIAIVGGGGTGAYILDFVAKTPVAEIHLFDADVFNTHNAFRAPGAPSLDELREQPLKVDYLKSIYSKMHRGIVSHPESLSKANVAQLADMQFVFLAMDGGQDKRDIVAALEQCKTPFVDVGMGLYVKNGSVAGIVRVTSSSEQQRKHVHENGRINFANDGPENDYKSNIQVADLNALNAVLAVIKWKKMFGFYFDFEREFFTTYTIDSNLLTSDDTL